MQRADSFLRIMFVASLLITGSLVAASGQPLSDLPEPRDDLDRFAGLYQEQGAEPHRVWMVKEIETLLGQPFPPGYMMIGATWGDVAPWRMTPMADNVFIRPELNEWEPQIVVQFVLDNDGRATGYLVTYGDQPTQELVRIGDVPPHE